MHPLKNKQRQAKTPSYCASAIWLMPIAGIHDAFGDNGGLIVDGAVGISKEAKLENVIVMTETVSE